MIRFPPPENGHISQIWFQEERDGDELRIWQVDVDGLVEDEILMNREVALDLAKNIIEMLE